ncbi:ZYRO0C06160p [Zygosaccharomyces rouxii]|uniref:ZYRO0C06160p n=1 Tax=Zygosaccharomyces rouxii (strain ATCC 2623 / CBS 732 / NBRC 1130 / NCYC 568 / NRRL Y-229) TaxID=559307 RepID=C5DT77_ZYGRC|nr:uncharacterized protein ZYRO0C06160g [Zygosaccharomyces rouxii]KAH9201830.1 cyclin-like protein [Zygosaccharomyces rouxii]CAR26988.1 ZYRO0C06160p [Zygosaccharomyces rouxii]
MGSNNNSGNTNIVKRTGGENMENTVTAANTSTNTSTSDLKEKSRISMLKRSNTFNPDNFVTPQSQQNVSSNVNTNANSNTNLSTPMVRSRRALTEVPVNQQKQPLEKQHHQLVHQQTGINTKIRREPSEVASLTSTKKRSIYKDEEEQEAAEESKSVKKVKSSSPRKWRDLDSDEKTDICMVTEYTDEIFDHLYKRELETLPTHNYLEDLDSPYHLRPSMRAILVDWLVEVHEKFQCYPETLFLTINIMDRFLAKNKVTLSKLQLLAVTSLFIAAKFEEVTLPKLSDYAYITDGAASKHDIKSAEMFMLTSLSFDIAWPNPMNFLRRISKADSYDFQTRSIGKFLLEYTMCCHKFINIKPSVMSAMSMFVARKISQRNNPIWDETFKHYSGDIDVLNDQSFQILCKELINEIASPQTRLDSLILKFKKPKYGAIYYKVYDWCKNQTENDSLDSLFSV